MITRDVFHIRLKGMELQAEMIIDPVLRTRPVAIISSDQPNGTIISLSPEAEKDGLFQGMKVSVVRKMSRSVQLLPYNRSLYTRVNRYIYNAISMFTPIIEPEGFDGFYLDMKGMRAIRGDMQNTGMSIIQRIHEQTNISGMVGISVNKLVSRIVTSVVPEKIHKVRRGKEAQFLSPLNPVVLPVVKDNYVKQLIRFLWIKQISHIQFISQHPDEFRTFFGDYAAQLFHEAHGYDSSVVKPPEIQDHVLEQRVLPEDTNDQNILYVVVKNLAEQVAFKLRKRQQVANKVKLEIHYTDGHHRIRTGRIIKIDDRSVIDVCQKLFGKANERRNRVRSILLDASDFRPDINQGELFPTAENRDMAVSKAVEKIRLKYGVQSLQTVDVFQVLGRI